MHSPKTTGLEFIANERSNLSVLLTVRSRIIKINQALSGVYTTTGPLGLYPANTFCYKKRLGNVQITPLAFKAGSYNVLCKLSMVLEFHKQIYTMKHEHFTLRRFYKF